MLTNFGGQTGLSAKLPVRFLIQLSFKFHPHGGYRCNPLSIEMDFYRNFPESLNTIGRLMAAVARKAI